jgi:hypothetical protein
MKHILKILMWLLAIPTAILVVLVSLSAWLMFVPLSLLIGIVALLDAYITDTPT